MGGGAAMRSAAKMAGISAFTNTFRSSAAVAENPVSVAARKLVRPDQVGLKIEQAVQRPAWELSDWEFAGCLDDENDSTTVGKATETAAMLVVDKDESDKVPARLVFGPVPSFEETNEATSELKDALEKVYLSSPKSSGSAGSLSSLHDTKACITHESVPKGAVEAFKLLRENPVAQTVVASIASDPNVWNAVMLNPTLLEFLESDKKYADLETQEPFKGSAGAKVESQDSSKSSVNNDNAEEPGKPDGLMGFIEDVKITVAEMVGRLTGFVESLFGEKKGETTYDSPKAFLAGGSFMALAMMVIMVVLMKRN